MRSLQGKISRDRRRGFRQGTPSSDAIRSFRARNRALIYRSAENVLPIRLAAEKYARVKSLKDVLQILLQKRPALFSDPHRTWNWDETSVLAEYGKNIKCFTPANANRGGTKLTIKDHGKHVTDEITVSAAGDVAPLFLVASGKKKMSRWFENLSPSDFSSEAGEPHWLTRKDWFPNETTVCVTDNGSIDQKTI